jgi:hypothetical protein
VLAPGALGSGGSEGEEARGVTASLIDQSVWREHERWLQEHARRCVEWHRWGDPDWKTAQAAADALWDRHRSGLYIFDAERALRETHYDRVAAKLAEEVRLDSGWLAGVLAIPVRELVW